MDIFSDLLSRTAELDYARTVNITSLWTFLLQFIFCEFLFFFQNNLLVKMSWFTVHEHVVFNHNSGIIFNV